jgi:SpoVK/Ycf46/Vps4 family AAA+-type ATPase
VFLRRLEYYRGVLILTTNRLHTIDTAFELRIHVILSFPELDRASRKVVWRNFLSLLKQGHNITEEDIDSISEYAVNGRQIKNGVKTAQLIAKKQKSQLEARHVLTFLQTVSLRLTASN